MPPTTLALSAMVRQLSKSVRTLPAQLAEPFDLWVERCAAHDAGPEGGSGSAA
jgi:hypothetical protein